MTLTDVERIKMFDLAFTCRRNLSPFTGLQQAVMMESMSCGFVKFLSGSS